MGELRQRTGRRRILEQYTNQAIGTPENGPECLMPGEMAIRRELCNEAIRLAAFPAEHPVGQIPETFALLALMHLHAARMAARQDETGGLLLPISLDSKRTFRSFIEFCVFLAIGSS